MMEEMGLKAKAMRVSAAHDVEMSAMVPMMENQLHSSQEIVSSGPRLSRVLLGGRGSKRVELDGGS